ncbi:hypothetical protein ACGFYZ_33700 [Streptomyces sp. NPDC048330]|uniref:hypothetical protein n=1 Tax=Streptomyces sp. NPDC048330 TaxID=3365533 RepID=UPI003723735A
MRRMHPHHRERINLIAFIAVLAFGIILLTAGIPAASLIVVTAGLAQLYAVFNTHRTPAHPHDTTTAQPAPAVTSMPLPAPASPPVPTPKSLPEPADNAATEQVLHPDTM